MIKSAIIHSIKNYFAVISLAVSVLILTGCYQQQGSITNINFQLNYQDTPLSCHQGFNFSDDNEDASKQWRYQQAQFYLSELAWQNLKGQWQSIELQSDKYQSHNIALIGEYCHSNGGSEKNWQLRLSKPLPQLSEIKALKFDIGVPFTLNHQNPLTQPSPLNVSNMFWVWQTGHKFVRIELAQYHNNSQITDNWLFHLGSTGCQAASPVRAPNQECRQPNRPTIELSTESLLARKASASQEQDSPLIITLDLAELVDNIRLGEASSCQSSSDNPSCQQLFNNIGVTAEQRVFSLDE